MLTGPHTTASLATLSAWRSGRSGRKSQSVDSSRRQRRAIRAQAHEMRQRHGQRAGHGACFRSLGEKTRMLRNRMKFLRDPNRPGRLSAAKPRVRALGRILVATNFDSASNAAVGTAANLARALGGSIHVLCVLEALMYAVPDMVAWAESDPRTHPEATRRLQENHPGVSRSWRGACGRQHRIRHPNRCDLATRKRGKLRSGGGWQPRTQGRRRRVSRSARRGPGDRGAGRRPRGCAREASARR